MTTRRLRRSAFGVATVFLLVVASGASGRSADTIVLRVVATQGGTVAGESGRVHCDGHCSIRVGRHAVVTLRASAHRYFSFDHWAGACGGTAEECVVSVDAPLAARAVFTRHSGDVLLTVGGPGIVVGARGGLTCGTAAKRCDVSWGAGATMTLRAQAGAGGVFSAWGGDCAAFHSGVCTLPVREDSGSVFQYSNQVTATFRKATPVTGLQPLAVSLKAQGGARPLGEVVSTPAGISCPPTCAARFDSGTSVKLESHSSAQTWSGACSGEADTCSIVVDGPTSVTDNAILGVLAAPPPYPLNITVSGRGTISDTTHRITGCTRQSELKCQTTFGRGARVVLTASAMHGSTFVGWYGLACAGKSLRCKLSVSDPSGTGVAAAFTSG